MKETINDTQDWREQFKKRPVAWSLGAAGGGFVVGYAIAAMVKGDYSRDCGLEDHVPSKPHVYVAGPIIGEAAHSNLDLREANRQRDKDSKDEKSEPGLLERFQQTEAYDYLRKEAATVGSRFVGELSQTAQEVVLPAAISWLREWLTGLVPETKTNTTKLPPESLGIDN